MNGILPLWKPKGLTSHDCVFKLRKILKTKKVGHTGTLDPEVEGVLPICIGGATKIIPYLSDLKKVYVAELTLGATTETEDATGRIIKEENVDKFPTEEQILKTFTCFLGKIKQTPPMYSAVRVNGKRLYEYARENIEVERPIREIIIHDLALLEFDAKKNTIKFEINCSKGTYIRTLCVDIGKHLGYAAHMSKLERIESDSFKREETFSFEEIEEASQSLNIESFIQPTKRALEHIRPYEVGEELKWRILCGQKLPLPTDFEMDLNVPYKVMSNNELLAIYHVDPNNTDQIRSLRVFNESKSEGENI